MSSYSFFLLVAAIHVVRFGKFLNTLETQIDFILNESVTMSEQKISKFKCRYEVLRNLKIEVSLKIVCLPYAVGKQPSITLIDLVR